MGYTHYLRQVETSPEQFKLISEDIKKVIEEVKNRGVSINGWDGQGSPEFSDKRIAFNGSEEKGEEYESFVFRQRDTGFSFCKTQVRPYDIAVQASYIVVNHYTGSEISSDGDMEDWESAVELVHEILGYGKDFELG